MELRFWICEIKNIEGNKCISWDMIVIFIPCFVICFSLLLYIACEIFINLPTVWKKQKRLTLKYFLNCLCMNRRGTLPSIILTLLFTIDLIFFKKKIVIVPYFEDHRMPRICIVFSKSYFVTDVLEKIKCVFIIYISTFLLIL